MTKRKDRSDSIQGELRRNREAGSVIAVPEGIKLNGADEEVLWQQFTSARAHEDWREFDLLILHKMVQLEIRIRKHNEMIDRTSAIIENKRGTMVESPLLRVVDTLQRQQLAMIRSLSLGVSADYARGRNSGGVRATEARAARKRRMDKGGNVFDLLAT